MFDVAVQKIDFSINGNSGSFLQTPFWGQFKSRHGWTLIRARASLGAAAHDFTILVRSFARGLFSMAYVPLFPSASFFAAAAGQDGEGAGVPSPDVFSALLSELAQAIKPFLPQNTISLTG